MYAVQGHTGGRRTRNAEIYDLKICDIYIPAGCTKITQELITDTRMDASVCGVPVFPVDHLDMTTFYNQVGADMANFRARVQADFAAWVDVSRAEIQELLKQLNELVEGDTVGALIAAINQKLPKSGGDMSGAINMNGHTISGLNSPSEDSDAATKGYVDNMTPTYTQETTLKNLVSGEKLSTSMGKIMRAITALISHINSKDNPHEVEADQLKSGTLSAERLPTVPVSKGGTGATNAAAARINLGTMSIVAIYGITVTFDNGKVTYSNSAIKQTSVCIIQRRSGTPGTATTSMFATTSGDGAVTIVTDNTNMTTANINILIVNP